MKRAYGRYLFVLVICIIFSFSQAWSATRRSASGKRAKASPAKRAAASKPKPATKARAKATPKRSTRRTRRTRRYHQTWSTSPYADSTSGDSLDGEDMVVRNAAAEALGPLNGSIVIVDPNTGRILSMVNQEVALGRSYIPCSTIKMPVALAAMVEGVVTKDTPVRLGRRYSLTLTDALAHSNNTYFEHLGRQVGFEKLTSYHNGFGFGEPACLGCKGENPGSLPEAPPRNGGVGRMSSFGEDISVTPLQLAAFVSSVANGGVLYYLQYPQTPEEKTAFAPRIKRKLDIAPYLPALREGMMAAVNWGTARRLSDPYDVVLGKTGTCSEGGTRLGWFASYAGSENPKIAVIVLLRGGRSTVGPLAAEVAGRVYRNLHDRNYYALRELHRTPPPAGLVPATGILNP